MKKPKESASDKLSEAIKRRKEKMGMNSLEESAELKQAAVAGPAKAQVKKASKMAYGK